MHILHDSQYTVIFSLCVGHLSLSPVGEVDPAFFVTRRVSKYCTERERERERGRFVAMTLVQTIALSELFETCSESVLRATGETMQGLTHQSKQLKRADVGRAGNVGCALMAV